MELNSALDIVKAAGYRVSKPKERAAVRTLNAVGKPFSPLYDPKYKLKTPLTSIARLRAPQNFPWVIVTA